ncbi:MAG: 6-phosphogluconolactonase [Planctomycetes bacterium]|nr:6-phosphogluconolactonase [Planctomycetota bacterium]
MGSRRAKAASPEIRVLADPEAVARAARDEVAHAILAAVGERGRCDLVLSGGSTPRRAHELLAAVELPWDRVHVFFGDERCVPPEHPDSNWHMARETLIQRARIPDANVHRIAGERDPEDAASDAENAIQEHFGLRPGDMPSFDLVLLGMGADGHTASLFPGTNALEESTRIVVANHVEKLGAWRVTMTFPVFEAAQRVLFLVTGPEKAAMVRSATVLRPGAATPPAGRVRPRGGSLVWLVDAAAATKLPTAPDGSGAPPAPSA